MNRSSGGANTLANVFPDYRRVLLRMLRVYRGLREAGNVIPDEAIKNIQRQLLLSRRRLRDAQEILRMASTR